MPRPKLKRIPIELLGDPRPLPLAKAQVQKLSDEWGAGGGWQQAWSDVDLLVERFLACPPGQGDAWTSAWHHLLMAVGNFKRSAGLILPAPLGGPTTMAARPDQITFPAGRAGGASLACEDPSTWTELTKITGLGVPTATTTLAALWPGRHVIIDISDMRAAVGISGGVLWNVEGFDDAHLPDVSTKDLYWQLYGGWFRPNVLATASDAVPPLDIERALFRLDERVVKCLGKRLPKKWRWSDYRSEATLQLEGSGS